jgi:acyl carrier protein phosphodiesterase
MRAQLEDQRQRETAEAEQRKNDQIKQLQASNARAFDRIQHYFSGITHNNLDVIKQNKAKIAKRKIEMNAIRKAVDELNAKRRKLEEPLNELIAENEKLSKEIDVYKQDKRDLARNKAIIRVHEDELRDLQLSQEVLEQRFEQLEQERDALYDQFESSIHDVRQKTEFRAYVLEQKVRRLHEELEQKEMQLQEVMQRSGADATAISAKIDDVIAVKNAKINQLEVELARVQRAHNDILTVYEQKMVKFGIPKDEIGFQTVTTPVEFGATTQHTD